MSEDILKSITLYGANNNLKWEEWFNLAISIIEKVGLSPTHISLESTNYKSGRVIKFKTGEKKVFDALENKENIEWLSIYSLPSNYKSATFDYEVLIIRKHTYINIIMNKSVFECIDYEWLIEKFKPYLNFDKGEIYEMNRLECPLLYAEKVNRIKSYKSLNIIEEF